MKLYATTTSERASKGQGGNEYLYIDIIVGDVKNQISAGRISVTPHNNEFILQYHETLHSDGITLKTISKGNQKKDKWPCEKCGGNRDVESRICNSCTPE